MTYPDSTPQAAGAGAAAWVFNVPPGWPAMPAGWQPPAGWTPDPSWPPAPADWEYWRPAPPARAPQVGAHAGHNAGRPGATAGELRLVVDGQSYVFQPGQVVRIGRAPDNDVPVGDPTVSRQHARLVWANGGWTFEGVGQAATWLHGQPVTRVAVTGPLDLTLGSAQGPVLRVEVPSAPGQRPTPPVGLPSRHVDHGAGHAGVHPTAELSEAVHILFPLRSWLHTSGLVRGLRLLVIVYALLPLVFLAVFASARSLTTPGWAYSLYIAPLWAIGFWQLIRPGRIRPLEVWVGVGIIAWVLVWINVVTVHVNESLYSPGQSLSPLAAIGVGFNEEITKGLPILVAGLVLLKFRSTKLDVRMWMFLGTVAGLTFGVFEQAFYTSQDIVLINQARVSSQAVEAVLAFAERVFVDGFQHAVWAGISAFFIGMAVNYRRRRVLLIVVGVSVPAVLHGLNDWSQVAFDSVWPSIIIQAVSLLLFLGYTMSAASIEQEVRETPLFRGESALMEAVDHHRHHGG
jgi:RsiW-degrading membrane proteinase PrsW (M82 family)